MQRNKILRKGVKDREDGETEEGREGDRDGGRG